MRRDPDIQFKRIAQLQLELDRVKKALMSRRLEITEGPSTKK